MPAGRPKGSKGKEKNVLISLKDLNAVLKEDALIPVSREFALQIVRNNMKVVNIAEKQSINSFLSENDIEPNSKIEFEIL